MTGAFSHLHVRSGFSYGYGVAMPEELVGAAVRMGMGSLALTDQDGLYGIPRFLEAASGAGLSPIVGAEVSVALAGSGMPAPKTTPSSGAFLRAGRRGKRAE